MNTAETHQNIPALESTKIRVLLVDDLEIVRLGVRMSLKDSPVVNIIGEAKDGLEAMAKARELQPDVILMDIALPEINGIVATKKIKTEIVTKVLILSSHEDEKTVFAALESGADGFCSKEAGADELLTAIRTIASGDTWLSDSVALKVLKAVSEPQIAMKSPEDTLSELDSRILCRVFEGASMDDVASEFGLSRLGADRKVNNILRTIATKDVMKEMVKDSSLAQRSTDPENKSSTSTLQPDYPGKCKFCPTCYHFEKNSETRCSLCNDILELDELIGSIFADRYEIESALGSGASSRVYKARHRFMKKPVAIKVLHSSHIVDLEILHRFRQEANAASSLKHKNISNVLDFGFTKDGKPFMIMEYLDGLNLEQIIERCQFLRWTDAVPIFIQICDALDCAHSRNILHRDLKPSNILVAREKGKSVIKVTDFGLAKIISTDGDGPLYQTKIGQTVGSPTYMSPEQALGLTLGPSTDIYALGTLMYETLVGHPPIVSDDIEEVLTIKCREEVAHINSTKIGASLPETLQCLVMGCLTREVEDRIPDMRAVKHQLEELLAKEQ